MDSNQHLTMSTLYLHVHQALRQWGNVNGTSENLLETLLLIRQTRREQGNINSPTSHRRLTNTLLLKNLKQLEKYDNEAMLIVQDRFIENISIAEVAIKYNISEDSVSRIQRRGIEGLTKILLEQEQIQREKYLVEVEYALPITRDTHLFGIEAIEETLRTKLLTSDGGWLTAVSGMGGIGKSAIAGRTILNCVSHFHFDDIFWLTVTTPTNHQHKLLPELVWQQLLSALAQRLGIEPEIAIADATHIRRLLRSKKLLIVIDNLEAPEDVNYLLSQIQPLTNPSKFLLTTRSIPQGDIPVFTCQVPELLLANAIELIRHQAHLIGINDLAQADEENLSTIYDIVGGNPLAIKIIVGLNQIMPLGQILNDLKEGGTQPIEQLYSRIYQQAWQAISDDAKTILLSMLLADATGIHNQHLQAVSQMPSNRFWRAVPELTTRSLLEMKRQSPDDCLFRIHAITETFLKNDIIQWDNTVQ